MLSQTLKKQPLAYITRDIERALGIAPTPGYVIMTNTSPFAKEEAARRGDVILVENETILDTAELLQHERIVQELRNRQISQVVVFKPTKQIEAVTKKFELTLINPPASLAEQIEEKITQLTFLPELRDIFLPFTVQTVKEVEWQGTPFVLQFNHSHTGSGTTFIENETELQVLQKQFPDRPVRQAPFISGPLYTNNNVITTEGTLVGNINYQITGLRPFTENRFATIGNDWALPHILLTPTQKDAYTFIAKKVGEALQKRGWKGLFGIDVLCDETTGQLYLLEINARQPASTTYESILQNDIHDGKTINTFAAHLLALLEEKNIPLLTPIQSGAQIVQKVTFTITDLHNKKEVQKKYSKHGNTKGYTIIPYTNTEPESDWVRIQTKKGLMANHNTFTPDSEQLIEDLEKQLQEC